MAERKMQNFAGGMGTGSIAPGSGYDYELGGAPKKEKASKTHITYTVGSKVTVVRSGKKIPVSCEMGGKPFNIEDGDRIETGDGSYVFSLMDVPNMSGNNPTTSISLFPNSAVELSTRHTASKSVDGGFDVITKVKFIEGMISFGGPAEFEFKTSVPLKVSPMMKNNAMSFNTEMRSDGSVAFFMAMAEIENTKTKAKAALFAKEIVVTPDGIYCLPAVEPRYEEAFKTFQLGMQVQAGAMGKKILENPGPSVDDFRKDMQGSIAANIAQMKKDLAENDDLPREVIADYKKQIADYEQGKGVSQAFAVKDEAREKDVMQKRKQAAQKAVSDGEAAFSKLTSLRLPSPQKLDDRYLVTQDKSERRTMSMDDYVRNAWDKSAKINELEGLMHQGKLSKADFAAKKKALEAEAIAPIKKQMEHNAKAGKEGEPMVDALLAKTKIGKTVQYGQISIAVREAEKGPEFMMRKAPAGSVFVALSVKLENNKSASTAYIVPDEEMWLNYGAGEPIKPENYKFETALDKAKPSEGYVYYIVPKDAKKFSFLLGKRTLTKIPVDFSV
ncbi:MAG: DUF4352 domain-containing protein [Candidatus Micrarchaeia archaeon]